MHNKWMIFTVMVSMLLPTAFAAPIISQSGNLINNGSLESGSFSPTAGHGVFSAASTWNQWQNSRFQTSVVPVTELITESEMAADFGIGIQDGNSALRVTTGGSGDGPFTFSHFGHSGWTSVGTSNTMTFSGWVYVVSGKMQFSVGSNATGFSSTVTTKTGEWEFISVTRTGSGNTNDELLLYSNSGAADFIVDSLWLNVGSTSFQSSQTSTTTTVPEPSAYVLLLLSGIIFGLYQKHK